MYDKWMKNNFEMGFEGITTRDSGVAIACFQDTYVHKLDSSRSFNIPFFFCVCVSQLQVLHAEYLDAASVLLFELVIFCQEVSSAVTHINSVV